MKDSSIIKPGGRERVLLLLGAALALVRLRQDTNDDDDGKMHRKAYRGMRQLSVANDVL